MYRLLVLLPFLMVLPSCTGSGEGLEAGVGVVCEHRAKAQFLLDRVEGLPYSAEVGKVLDLVRILCPMLIDSEGVN